MSFLDLNLTDVKPPRTVTPGEYKLRGLSAEVNIEKSFILCRFSIVGPGDAVQYDDTKDVSYFIYLPKPDDDPKKVGNKKRMIRAALETLKVPFNENGFDAADIQGKEVWAILGEQNDEKYGMQNTVERLVKSA